VEIVGSLSDVNLGKGKRPYLKIKLKKKKKKKEKKDWDHGLSGRALD
jgi:rRNA processing protein Gar1